MKSLMGILVSELPKVNDPDNPIVVCRGCDADVRNTMKGRGRHMDICPSLTGHYFRVERLKVSKLEAEARIREKKARQEEMERSWEFQEQLRKDLITWSQTRVASKILTDWLSGKRR